MNRQFKAKELFKEEMIKLQMQISKRKLIIAI